MKTKMVLSVSNNKPPRTGPRGDRAPGGRDLRARIILAAREKFLAYGFTAVTTDDISDAVGISKATLYKHFASKEEILTEVVESIKTEIAASTQKIVTDREAAFLDKVTRMILHIGEWFSRMSPALVKDLPRSVPWVWEQLEAFRTQRVLLYFRGLLESGVREGDVRPDVDLDLAVQMFLALVQKFLRPDVLGNPRYSGRAMLRAVFDMVFGGILTGPAREAFFARDSDSDSLNKEVVP